MIREYNRHVAEPLNNFIDKINQQYPGDKKIRFISNNLNTTITLPNRNTLKIILSNINILKVITNF